MTDPREAKLPKWAQQELANLRRINQGQREKLLRQTALGVADDAVVWVDRYSDHPVPIARANEYVRFAFDGIDGRKWIDVKHDGTSVHIDGSGRLAIEPHVTNVIEVMLRERV